ncbi:unnamed protein product, partial [Didymodactylos carnosus]
LPTKGTFNHHTGGESLVSSQEHFTAAIQNAIPKTMSGESAAFTETSETTSSFAPPLIDQQAAQSIGKESLQ